MSLGKTHKSRGWGGGGGNYVGAFVCVCGVLSIYFVFGIITIICIFLLCRPISVN